MRRRTAVLLPLIAIATGTALLAPASDAKSTATPSFGVPRIVDPIHVYGEPNLEVNPKTGAIHATGPQGTGTQRSIWNISVDGGDSYRIVQNLPPNTDHGYVSGLLPTKSALGPGGGDTEIKIAHNGRAFFNDLAALVDFSAVTTPDDGATTQSSPVGIDMSDNLIQNQDAGGDRQWMALFDPQPSDHTMSPYKGPLPLNYMEYQSQAQGADVVDMTTDGVNYSHLAGAYANDAKHAPDHGVPLVDQHTGKFLGLTSATTTKAGNAGPDLSLVVGVPDAQGALTFHYHDVALGLPGDPQTLFPVLAQDGARNLYVTWIDSTTYTVWYSWAAPGKDNEWSHWHEPIQVNKAPARTNVFPWITAGKAPGIVDIAWYGTDQSLKQLGANGPSEKKGQAWNLWFAQVDRAATAHPHIVQVKAAPHPMHYNDICMLGTLCISGQGNRNQADFFKMTVNPRNGRAMIIYTDSSNRLSQAEGTDSAADHQGAALDTVVTQNTGLSALTGLPLTPYESTAPVSAITAPAGRALFKPLGGSYVPGADIRSLKITQSGGDLVFTLKTDGSLASAAVAAGTPNAQLVVRWQMGDVLYFVAADASAAGNTTYYGGKTNSTDLCSVSGCKPNYLTYDAPPSQGVSAITGSNDGNTFVLRIPLSSIGNPTKKSLLEEVMAFTTASPQAGVAPQNNGADFADIAPLMLDGTRTFNYRFGAPASPAKHAPALALFALLGTGGVALRRRLSAPLG